MDPVTALGLACSVMQVIDFGLKIIHICKEVHAEGSSRANQALAGNAQYLKEAASEVQQGLIRSSQTGNVLTQSEVRLREVATQCTKSATKLQNELKKVEKVRGTGILSSVRTTFQVVMRKDTIEEIRVEMAHYQTILQTDILVHMKSEQARNVLKDESRLNKLDHRLTLFIRRLTEGQTQMSELLKSEETQTRLIVQDEGQHVRDHIDLKYETMKLDTFAQESQQRLMASLKYPQMNERWNAVKDPHEGTYEWIFDDTTERPWSPLVPFFKSDERLYWVQGKPGSGKSSLMKLIYTDPRTRDALDESRSGTPSTIISFFFWMAGIPIQRSSKGLWCSLLFQLLDEHQTIIQRLRSDFPSLDKKESIDDWSLKELYDVFGRSVELISTPICIFLDGLDEFDQGEGPIEIIRHVDKLKSLSNVKLCVSSRPEPHLDRWLRKYPQLKLQQLTEKDIRQYARDVLCGASMGDSFDTISEGELSHLQDMVVEKANGVFIWVYYSLNSLVKGLLGGDNWSELTNRLEQMPNEIMDLYHHMWNRLNEDKATYRAEAATYFRFVLEWSGLTNNAPCNMIGITTAANMSALRTRVLEQWDDIPVAEFIKQCHTAELRLVSRCAGLLEINEPAWLKNDPSPIAGRHSPSEGLQLQLYYGKLVGFIHRTVYDFLQGTEDGQKIMIESQKTESESTIFYFNVHLLRYSILEPTDRTVTMTELILNIPLGEGIRRLPPDKRNEMFHLLVRCIQHILSAEGFTCPLDGWNFPMTYFPSPPAIDFVGKAAVCGYASFVRSYVQRVGGGRKLAAKYLNYLLLCSSDLQQSALWGSYNGSLLSMLDSFALTQELLDKGADPNFQHYCYRGPLQDSKGLYYATSPVLAFLAGSSITNFYGDPEYEAAWHNTLQKFLHANVGLESTIPIVIGASIGKGATEVPHSLFSLHKLYEMDGTSMVVEFSVADLLRGVSWMRFDKAPFHMPADETSKQQTRVLYLRRAPDAPPEGLEVIEHVLPKHPPEHFRVATEQDSEILVAALSHYWKEYQGKYWSTDNPWNDLEAKMLEVIERSERIDDVEKLNEDFSARGWIADQSSIPDIGEPFDTKTMDESVQIPGEDTPQNGAVDDSTCTVRVVG